MTGDSVIVIGVPAGLENGAEGQVTVGRGGRKGGERVGEGKGREGGERMGGGGIEIQQQQRATTTTTAPVIVVKEAACIHHVHSRGGHAVT